MLEQLVNRRYWWFRLSFLLIVPGLYFLLLHPLITTGRFELGLRASIDFSGGALWEVRFADKAPDEVTSAEVFQAFSSAGFENPIVQMSQIEVDGMLQADALVRTRALLPDALLQERQAVEAAVNEQIGPHTIERLESVGPTVSRESTINAFIAVIGALLAILLYLWWAFREAPHPFRYGMCAVISIVHDVLIVIGFAAIFSALNPRFEVDALFLTALLTTLSFSVHDTIVVFDRVRENLLDQQPGESFGDIVNHSLVQTLPRSINTQFTTLFTLTALILFGGETLRNFVIVLLIGLISGTYSSIFNAAQLLVVWEYREWRTWFGRGRGESGETPAPTAG
ncbi:protein translocase subunit SecF [Candidatus Viridilinea mediisalina]|uniref:Protein-export membrane protein SecF n=1 Tax=Candidatus Viridilinea mediisalina TaxID=2024553 RepID=A0A2A6RHW9_9CHLR|nr:protein translocase subunit SecF [Candidatus Viridilinea mediisalina]PDW02475.1 protein translocase subunit SecF [Candidatus Viridilinea mediisalina]